MQTSEVKENNSSVPPSVLANGADVSYSVPSMLFEPNPTFEVSRQRSRIGTGTVVIRNFLVLNNQGIVASSCDYDEELILYYLLEVCAPTDSDFIVGVRFRDLKGNFVYSTNDLSKIHRLTAVVGERFVVWTRIKVPLAQQDYVILTGVFGFSDGLALGQRHLRFF